MVCTRAILALKERLLTTVQSLSELDVLLALCKAAPHVQDIGNAKRLLLQLSPYIEEAHNQVLAPSPFLKSIEPSLGKLSRIISQAQC